jgi:MFS family permease
LRTGWGRRIPFLLLTTPFIVLSVLGLAFCPQLGGCLQQLLGRHSPGTAPSVLIVLAILWTVFDMSVVTAASVFGGLLNDVVPTEVLGRFFGLFRIVSLVVGIVFFFWLMKDVETHFTPIFLGVAIIYGLGFSLMCFKVKEGDYPPPPVAQEGPGNAMSSVRAYFKDGFGHPYYLWFFAATILGGMATGPVNLYSIFYAKSLSMDTGTFGKCLGVTYCISLCLSYPLGSLVDRFHPLRLTIGVLLLYLGAMAISFYFVHSVNAFAVALVVHGVISGTYGTISASLSQRLLPRAKFAEIGSAGGIIASLAGMAMAPVLGAVLDYKDHDYRYTFLAGLIFTVSALVAFAVLHGKFMILGGPARYVAPE